MNRGWFILDILSLIQVDYYYNNITILQFIRLVRIPKIFSQINTKVFEKNLNLFRIKEGNSLILLYNFKYGYKIFKLFVIAVSFTFSVACGWWFFIDNYSKEEEELENNFIYFTSHNFFNDSNFTKRDENNKIITSNYSK